MPGGLGGTAPGVAAGQGTTGAAQDTGKVGKESSVPQELATTIDELKAFIKEEKDVSSEVRARLNIPGRKLIPCPGESPV